MIVYVECLTILEKGNDKMKNYGSENRQKCLKNIYFMKAMFHCENRNTLI